MISILMVLLIIESSGSLVLSKRHLVTLPRNCDVVEFYGVDVYCTAINPNPRPDSVTIMSNNVGTEALHIYFETTTIIGLSYKKSKYSPIILTPENEDAEEISENDEVTTNSYPPTRPNLTDALSGAHQSTMKPVDIDTNLDGNPQVVRKEVNLDVLSKGKDLTPKNASYLSFNNLTISNTTVNFRIIDARGWNTGNIYMDKMNVDENRTSFRHRRDIELGLLSSTDKIVLDFYNDYYKANERFIHTRVINDTHNKVVLLDVQHKIIKGLNLSDIYESTNHILVKTSSSMNKINDKMLVANISSSCEIIAKDSVINLYPIIMEMNVSNVYSNIGSGNFTVQPNRTREKREILETLAPEELLTSVNLKTELFREDLYKNLKDLGGDDTTNDPENGLGNYVFIENDVGRRNILSDEVYHNNKFPQCKSPVFIISIKTLCLRTASDICPNEFISVQIEDGEVCGVVISIPTRSKKNTICNRYGVTKPECKPVLMTNVKLDVSDKFYNNEIIPIHRHLEPNSTCPENHFCIDEMKTVDIFYDNNGVHSVGKFDVVQIANYSDLSFYRRSSCKKSENCTVHLYCLTIT